MDAFFSLTETQKVASMALLKGRNCRILSVILRRSAQSKRTKMSG
jgi:hypothetical protein